MKKRTRNADQYLDEAIHAFELALSEVFVVERRHEGKVTHRSVRNKDALDRAKTAYARAVTAVGMVQVDAGIAAATVAALREARARLEQARLRLNELVELAKAAS